MRRPAKGRFAPKRALKLELRREGEGSPPPSEGLSDRHHEILDWQLKRCLQMVEIGFLIVSQFTAPDNHQPDR